MVFLNESEIDRAVEILSENSPEIAPYAKYLSDWRDIVNESTDGWPYWKAGLKAGSKLSELVSQAVDALRRRGETPSEAAFKRALAPIKSCATRNKLRAPEITPAPAPSVRM